MCVSSKGGKLCAPVTLRCIPSVLPSLRLPYSLCPKQALVSTLISQETLMTLPGNYFTLTSPTHAFLQQMVLSTSASYHISLYFRSSTCSSLPTTCYSFLSSPSPFTPCSDFSLPLTLLPFSSSFYLAVPPPLLLQYLHFRSLPIHPPFVRSLLPLHSPVTFYFSSYSRHTSSNSK